MTERQAPDEPESAAAGALGGSEQIVDMGVCESDAGDGYVWVIRDGTGQAVRAKWSGYADDYAFERGEETGLEIVGGEWCTIPVAAHTLRLEDRVEWWAKNRRTGAFRMFARRSRVAP